MRLIYFDESGNTGNNLTDPEQPVFVLAALIVPDFAWQALEEDLKASFVDHFPSLARQGVEVHATEIASGRKHFRNIEMDKRIHFRDEWMEIAIKHELKIVYRAINKRRYAKWQANNFGSGVSINPQVSAFALLSSVVDGYLKEKDEFGMFIFDDNKEVTKDIEKSLKFLKLADKKIKIERVIEKGFFIESSKSLVLQLCDLFVYAARKKEEHENFGKPLKHVNASAVPLLDKITHEGDEKFSDVISWISGDYMSQ